jgi:hypothetical protein
MAVAERVQPISDEELSELLKGRNATGKRLERMQDYNGIVENIVAQGGRGKVALDGEDNTRSLSLRLSHAANRLGVKIETMSLPTNEVVVRVIE